MGTLPKDKERGHLPVGDCVTHTTAKFNLLVEASSRPHLAWKADLADRKFKADTAGGKEEVDEAERMECERKEAGENERRM